MGSSIVHEAQEVSQPPGPSFLPGTKKTDTLMKLAVLYGPGAVEYERLAEDLARIHAQYPDLTIRGGGLCAAIRWGYENGVPIEELLVTGPESMADADAQRKRDRRLIDGADKVGW
jgi:hypothetical protein